ncbi:hypothetical protein U9M48_001605 [Paspalum notatum var. saurae]|uniref:Uncharacterized protein n=1 Tax=Paspalum notatum var. saurae TaxID=547442 RepID=A0AAQ3PNW1_PASNO
MLVLKASGGLDRADVPLRLSFCCRRSYREGLHGYQEEILLFPLAVGIDGHFEQVNGVRPPKFKEVNKASGGLDRADVPLRLSFCCRRSYREGLHGYQEEILLFLLAVGIDAHFEQVNGVRPPKFKEVNKPANVNVAPSLIVPEVGMCFEYEDEAYKMYNTYVGKMDRAWMYDWQRPEKNFRDKLEKFIEAAKNDAMIKGVPHYYIWTHHGEEDSSGVGTDRTDQGISEFIVQDQNMDDLEEFFDADDLQMLDSGGVGTNGADYEPVASCSIDGMGFRDDVDGDDDNLEEMLKHFKADILTTWALETCPGEMRRFHAWYKWAARLGLRFMTVRILGHIFHTSGHDQMSIVDFSEFQNMFRLGWVDATAMTLWCIVTSNQQGQDFVDTIMEFLKVQGS